jgi:4'-phosphopantetheinyl transferase
VESTLLHACDTLMSSDERSRHESLRFERDRCLFLATRLLVRTVLSRYAQAAPAEWQFVSDGRGKPRIAHPAVSPALHFNLANTPGLVVCAVSAAHRSIGVDVERTDRTVDFMAVAHRCFSRAEASAVEALPSAERARRFFEYWTLKESYVKALGVGLSLPLDEFSFTNDDRGIRIRFDRRTAEDETRWGFALMEGSPVHIIAVGANTGGAALSLRAAHVVPLDSTGSR